jgi:hypothetical protein
VREDDERGAEEVNIIVHRWPIKEDTGGHIKRRRIVRTQKPTASFNLHAELGAKGLVHVTFPELGGVWDFRLSTGLPTTDKIYDYVIDADSLVELRALKGGAKP